MLTRCNHTFLNYNIRSLLRSSLIMGLLSLSLLGSGCLYRIDIQQGNVVDAAMLAKLKQGMNFEQVRYILGTPLLKDVFHEDRWDYYYSLSPSKGEKTEHKIQLYFENKQLQRLSGDAGLNIPDLEPLQEQDLPRNKPLL